jgi:DNA replication protein DnaC
MLIEQTKEKLSKMKLYGMVRALEDRLTRADHADLPFTDLLGLLVDDEWLYRENRKLTSLLKNAKFKLRDACIENIEYPAHRGLKKTQVLELAQNRWIVAHQNILITGPAGAGKSYLAQALGNNACRQGISVNYVRVPTLLFSLLRARADGTYGDFLKRIGKVQFLILDDFGMSALTDQEKQDLVEIAEERYGSGSTVVTSQLPTHAWHEYLGGGRVADALLERLLHNGHRIDLQSRDSMRKEKNGLTQSGHSAN